MRTQKKVKLVTFNGLCPNCGRVSPWTFEWVSFSLTLAPTGGDYDWVETEASTQCPACKGKFVARVQVDIVTGKIDKLVSSPIPQLADWHCYVVATVYRFDAELVEVHAMQFLPTLTQAEEVLTDLGGGYDRGYERRAILILSNAGFQELDCTPLHESANGRIQYAETFGYQRES